MRLRTWNAACTMFALVALFVPALLLMPRPSAGQAARTKINPKDGAEMVFVSAGEFLMGSTAKQIDAILASEDRLDRGSVVGLAPVRERIHAERERQKREQFESETPQRRVYLGGYWIYT